MREEEGPPPGAIAISPPASPPTTTATVGQLPPPLPPPAPSSVFSSPLFTLYVNSGEAHYCRPSLNGWAGSGPIQKKSFFEKLLFFRVFFY
jgi:hypothetical protein